APPEQRFSGPIIVNGQHPYYMFTGVPNTLGQMVPQMGGANNAENLVKLNSLGFRIEGPLERPKPAGELRIFVLGDRLFSMERRSRKRSQVKLNQNLCAEIYREPRSIILV